MNVTFLPLILQNISQIKYFLKACHISIQNDSQGLYVHIYIYIYTFYIFIYTIYTIYNNIYTNIYIYTYMYYIYFKIKTPTSSKNNHPRK